MGHLGNHMLNAADYHASERGFGMDYLMPLQRSWVLSRLVIEMEEMPQWNTSFSVETWVESAMRFFTNRNFAVRAADGKVIGYGRSVWAMIDMQTRQPVDILAMQDGSILKYVDAQKPCPIDKPPRVKMGQEVERVGCLTTHYSDVDVNGHINSVKYIEHILDMWPVEWYKTHRLKRLDIAYVAESYFGDTLHFSVERRSDEECDILVQKTSDDSPEMKEVCRCKLTFAKK